MTQTTSSFFSFSRLLSKMLLGHKGATGKESSSANGMVTAAGTPAVSQLLAMRSMLSKGAAFCCAFGPDLSRFEIPRGLSVSNQIDEEGQEYLLLRNGSPKAGSHGITGGFSIRLPNAVETEASNRHVTIKVVARAANEMQSRFALAYSTNEVGNSGWRWFDAAPVWSVYTMEWDVPRMRTGNGDFIGILPDVEGKPGTEFGWLAVLIG